jgi:hypothetical protein
MRPSRSSQSTTWRQQSRYARIPQVIPGYTVASKWSAWRKRRPSMSSQKVVMKCLMYILKSRLLSFNLTLKLRHEELLETFHLLQAAPAISYHTFMTKATAMVSLPRRSTPQTAGSLLQRVIPRNHHLHSYSNHSVMPKTTCNHDAISTAPSEPHCAGAPRTHSAQSPSKPRPSQ